MFFAKIAKAIATLALIFGLWRVGIGVYVASIEPFAARDAARARYIGSKSSGQAIDQGIYMIAFAAALGTMASMALKRKE